MTKKIIGFRNRSGFTLVEILIAMSILSMILVTIYAAFYGTVRVIRTGVQRRDAYQYGRLAIEAIRRDLMCAFPVPGAKAAFKGVYSSSGSYSDDNARIDFVAASNIMADPGEDRRESDICEVGYFISEEHDGVLVRRSDPTVDNNPFSGGKLEPIAEKVTRLNFQYYDGTEWVDEWNPEDEEAEKKLTGLPPIVWIEVTVLDEEGEEHTCSTTVLVAMSSENAKDAAEKKKKQEE